MLQGDVPEEMDEPEKETFECPKCHQTFKHRRSLDKHVDFTCKKKKSQDVLMTPRVTPVTPVPVTMVRIDTELDGLLATIDSDYVR